MIVPHLDNKISVVITTYNRSALLKRAIESVLVQTHRNIECIIIDDCSTDNTAEVVNSYCDSRIYYEKNYKNMHLSASRNLGVSKSTGGYIAFLDDDDEWMPEKLEKQLDKFLTVSTKFGLIYCWMEFVGQKKRTFRKPTLKGEIFNQVLTSQPLGNGSTYLIRKEVFEKIGGFDVTLKRGIDGDFIRRLCQKYSVDYVPEVLIKYHVSHGGHRRITTADHEGIKTAIAGELEKFEKFESELLSDPEASAIIYAKISCLYAEIGEFRNWFKYVGLAITKKGASRSVLKLCLSGLRHLVSS